MMTLMSKNTYIANKIPFNLKKTSLLHLKDKLFHKLSLERQKDWKVLTHRITIAVTLWLGVIFT